MKKLVIPWKDVRELGYADVMGRVNGVAIPITMDSGAEISLVPKEAVQKSCYTGETSGVQGFFKGQVYKDVPVVKVTFNIDDECIPETALALPGEELEWTAVFSAKVRDKKNRDRFIRVMEKRDTLTEEQTRFLPPFLKDGILNSAVLLSEGVDSDSSEQTKSDCDRETPRLEVSGREPVVNEVTESHDRGTTSEDVTTMTEKHNEDDEMVGNNAVEIAGEDSGLGRNELVLGRGEMLPSVVEEAEGGEEEGSTEVEGNRVEEVSSCEGDDTPDPPMDVIISSIGDSPSRAKLVLATSQDTSLDIPKRLAQTQSEGYSVEEGFS